MALSSSDVESSAVQGLETLLLMDSVTLVAPEAESKCHNLLSSDAFTTPLPSYVHAGGRFVDVLWFGCPGMKRLLGACS